MEKIIPFQFWQNGSMVTATEISCSINFDNLKDDAVFYYSLKDADGNKLTDGNVDISGKDYIDWTTNQEAYQYVCKKLGVTLSN